MTVSFIIEMLGTLAFAISGIRLASAKKFDWFGAYVVGFTTAIGGGTMRDVMLSVTPFWMLDSVYLVVTAIALGIVIVLGRYLIRLNNHLFRLRRYRSGAFHSCRYREDPCGRIPALGGHHHGYDDRSGRRRVARYSD